MPIDPRTITTQTFGTPLRDGAVDPKDTDFLGPTNAGKEGEAGNPHGPNVINPEIHASQGVRPVLEGPVGTADEQNTNETAAVSAWNGGGTGGGASFPGADTFPGENTFPGGN